MEPLILSLISIAGAVAAWIPYVTKKPQLSVRLSLHQEGGGSYTTSAFSKPYLNLIAENKGNEEANNIHIEVVKNFYTSTNAKLSKQVESEKISGDLLPGETVSITISVNKENVTYPYNHLVVTIFYESTVAWVWQRKVSRQTTWFFPMENGQFISNDLYRINKLDTIPADLWPDS